MAATRRTVDESEAEELVAAWRASKRGLSAWCAANGIDGRSLRYWANRLDARTPVIRMVEMVAPTAKESPSIHLQVEDVVLILPDGFQEETLARVLRVVRGC